ncbi:MAG TPA: UDP-N-acetylmuramoyl-L-alanyl-D-glutamate--2,6-diaminopimelate ligase [Steroidobacteraceae bacterium]|nr:UDP-N-acetylmuramoyl-L-alanyl-D-glutamate--2,6-diaminopimelate ligase [Steroidobacteraceae bacterium]
MNVQAPGISLLWLLDGIVTLPAATDARVADLTLDSREARAGSLFFALGGLRSHGLKFAADAAARGASVVLWDPPAEPHEELARDARSLAAGGSVFVAPVAGLKALVGRIADRFFGWPSSHMRVVGITGTNGKTTCAYLLASCLGRLRSEAAYIGTIGWGRVGSLKVPTHTTPDAVSVHRQLSMLRADGVRDVAMEVSSHALDQGRVDGVRFHSVALTNLTRDHLDYHPSMEAYGAAKALLFASSGLQHIVINVGDGFGRTLAGTLGGRAPLTAVWVGAGGSGWLADRSLRADDIALDRHGLSMSVDGSFGSARVRTKLMGRFNAENAVVVLACLAGLNLPLGAACAALSECDAPPGRMEVIEPSSPAKPLAVIDYAHTPDALAKALQALREHCRGTLWCVFGCGGDRDPGKRPLMGAVADELADRIIVTDDNPRSENPRSITGGITAGITAHAVRVINDRSEAIAAALTEAAAGDVVLIAGKGHEDYQIYGGERRSFSDRTEALRHLGAAA